MNPAILAYRMVMQPAVTPEPPAGYVPNFVSNGGTGTLTFDGSAAGWPDSTFFDMAFLIGNIGGGGAVRRVFNNRGPRHDVLFGTTGIPRIILRNSASTALVDWSASGSHTSAGYWLFHIAGDFGGSPSFGVSKIEVVETSPGVWETSGDWSALSGSFATGPTGGTLDNQFGGTGTDLSIFCDITGATIMNGSLGYLWWSVSTPLADSAFAADGVLIDPTTIGSPNVLVTGPLSDITDDKGSANVTFTAAGDWADA